MADFRVPLHWIIVNAGTGIGFKPKDVYCWPAKNEHGPVLPLFTNHGVVNALITEFAVRGIQKEAATLATANEMTDLLSTLQDAGVTHVAFDPDPRSDLNLVPIAVAIIRFQVDGDG